MKRTNNPRLRTFHTATALGLVVLWLAGGLPVRLLARQVIREVNGQLIMGGQPNMPSSPQPGPSPGGGGAASGGTWVPSEPLSTNSAAAGTNNDDIQLSFQGANIDMVAQWLAKTTGKTVIPHPQVQCQLTIISGQKVSPREAINTVYRALGLQGFSVVELSSSILIVPEGKEPKMSPEIVDETAKTIPEGRQRLTRVFSLTHVQAAQIRDKIRAALTDKATLDVDERQNQIIITDYNDNIRVVGKLIAALDSDKPVDIAIRVIPLKHISGDDLAKELAPLYQRMNSENPKDSIDVVADDRSNALIVFSSQAGFNALAQVIAMLDTEGAQEKATETFLLKNADAQDVAKQLQDLGQSGAINSRYVYYVEEGSSDQNNSASKKMSVVADKRRNAVIVQAVPTDMEAVRKMIEQLDEPVAGDSLAPKIYHLKYASAADVEDVLNELFLKKQQQRSYYDYVFGNDSDSSSSDSDVGRLYGKVRITSEPYSNTIIVTANSKESLDAVEQVLQQLDAPSEAGESTLRVGLRFAKADDVAKNLNILFAKNGSPPLRPETPQNQPNAQQQNQPQQPQSANNENDYSLTEQTKEEGYYPWLGGQPDIARGDNRAARPVSDLVGRVRVVSDPRINALLVSANVHYFPQVLKLIDDLDAVTDQVLIEARIVEVSSDYMDRLGVRYSPDGTQVFTTDDFDNSLMPNVTAAYMKGFGGTTSVNTPPAPSSTLAQTLTSLRSGVLDSTMNMDFLIQFLRRTVDATVVDEPQITINDNELGRLFVGQEVPAPNDTQVNAISGGQNTTVLYRQAGVTLEVTPHINSSGDVQLRVHVESSTLDTQQVLNAPVFDTQQFRTDLTAKHGQTLVLGGIIQRQISDTVHKTVILGDIPGLRWAFRKKDKSTQQVQLMVFLHPTVIHTPEDAQGVLEHINQEAPQMKKWQDDSQEQMKK